MGMMGSRGSKGLVSDINVTPLVDVMLVLLIIFMVTAPMLSQSDDIKLPETSAKELRQQGEPLAIVINKNGQFKLKESEMMAEDRLIEELKKMPDKTQIIHISADQDVPYETIYSLFMKLQENGFTEVGMVTKPVDSAAVKRQ